MDKVIIYEFQLKAILNTLNSVARFHHSSSRETCMDRDIMQAVGYAKNALEGNFNAQTERFGSPLSEVVE